MGRGSGCRGAAGLSPHSPRPRTGACGSERRPSVSYVSLYRKYRSQRFADLCGQEHVTVTLQNSVRGNRVAHAYVFCGPRGTGKTSAARLLAKALNCQRGPAPEPCDECESCLEIRAGSSLDVIEIDAASHRGIDDVRAIREAVAYHPVQGRYKVYVIDEVHMLTGEAFNALLKTLEQPPAHVVFILATTEAHKVPATILSRCQRFDFRRGGIEQLRERLLQVIAAEGIAAEDAAVDLLARHASGSWRDALSLLEQAVAYAGNEVTAEAVRTVLGLVDEEVLSEVAGCVCQGKADRALELIEETMAAGKDPRQLLRDLTEHFRDLLLCAAGAGDSTAGERRERLREQAAAFGLPRLLDAVDMLASAEKELRWSQQSRILLEVLVVRLARALVHAAEGAAAAAAGARPGATGLEPARDGRAVTASPSAGTGRPASSRPTATAASAPPADGTVPAPGGDRRAGAREDGGREPGSPPPVDRRAGVPSSAGAEGGLAHAAPPGPEAAGPEALETIRRQWRLIREELKRRRMANLHALLVDAQPRALQGDLLTVELPTRSWADLVQMKTKESPQAIPEVISDLCGVRCRIRVVTAGEDWEDAAASQVSEPAPPPESAAQEPARPPRAAPAGEGVAPGRELVHDVVDLFDGRIVDEER
jgi:DNA polymerase-3 subunit gamma/tau